METLLSSIYYTQAAAAVSMSQFALATGVSLLLGLVIAAAYMQGTRYTKSFVITLALLPAIICVIIMMVNGNIGAGVAVAGAFGLIRFRSAPGSASAPPLPARRAQSAMSMRRTLMTASRC